MVVVVDVVVVEVLSGTVGTTGAAVVATSEVVDCCAERDPPQAGTTVALGLVHLTDGIVLARSGFDS